MGRLLPPLLGLTAAIAVIVGSTSPAGADVTAVLSPVPTSLTSGGSFTVTADFDATADPPGLPDSVNLQISQTFGTSTVTVDPATMLAGCTVTTAVLVTTVDCPWPGAVDGDSTTVVVDVDTSSDTTGSVEVAWGWVEAGTLVTHGGANSVSVNVTPPSTSTTTTSTTTTTTAPGSLAAAAPGSVTTTTAVPASFVGTAGAGGGAAGGDAQAAAQGVAAAELADTGRDVGPTLTLALVTLGLGLAARGLVAVRARRVD